MVGKVYVIVSERVSIIELAMMSMSEAKASTVDES